jgi:kynurenine formamidase
VFGDDDEIGTVNYLTTETTLEAIKLVKKGKAFRLDLPLHLPGRAPDAAERRPVRHSFVVSQRTPTALSDQLDDFDTQVSSQWDGLKHHHHPEYGYYNGATREQVLRTKDDKLGIQQWANRIVGRGLLLDVEKFRDDHGRPADHTNPDPITLDDLLGTVADQGVEVKQGDILLVRTGAMKHYLEANERAGENLPLPWISNGILPGRDIAEWLWDSHVAMIAADNRALEQSPWLKDLGPLHYRLIPLLGLPLGELFYLEELAADSAEDGVYESMVVSAPIVLQGGVASPPNALAFK